MDRYYAWLAQRFISHLLLHFRQQFPVHCGRRFRMSDPAFRQIAVKVILVLGIFLARAKYTLDDFN